MSTASRSRSDRRTVALAIVAAVAVAACLPPGLVAAAPSICLFRNVSGLPCPGCGLTRSIVATAHLRLGDALGFHPFGPLLLAVSLAWALLVLAGRAPAPPDWRRNRLLQVLAAAWLAWAMVRMA